MLFVLLPVIHLAISLGLLTLTLNGCCRGQNTALNTPPSNDSVPQRTSIINIQTSEPTPKSSAEPDKSVVRSDEKKGEEKEPSKRDVDDVPIRTSKKKGLQTAIKKFQPIEPTERISMHGSDVDTQETQGLESSQVPTIRTARSSRRSMKRRNNGKLKSLEATQSQK
ncbi:unnamed protein product [Bursaphelenchus xylophilus]|uniref:(pine wood nematode) hypothetical protein n=1 Tax=Bursaphelenchus xylophilus TaxID=6326 RepID=A0A1I7RT96_BURXY|nr:unnamed protein product [Bursaphelenchus xylophilus]CAG9122529.1 unnamed protein product [Bursaphelenchus xylophilus]